jgi:hypothetical protein
MALCHRPFSIKLNGRLAASIRLPLSAQTVDATLESVLGGSFTQKLAGDVLKGFSEPCMQHSRKGEEFAKRV